MDRDGDPEPQETVLRATNPGWGCGSGRMRCVGCRGVGLGDMGLMSVPLRVRCPGTVVCALPPEGVGVPDNGLCLLVPEIVVESCVP